MALTLNQSFLFQISDPAQNSGRRDLDPVGKLSDRLACIGCVHNVEDQQHIPRRLPKNRSAEKACSELPAAEYRTSSSRKLLLHRLSFRRSNDIRCWPLAPVRAGEQLEKAGCVSNVLISQPDGLSGLVVDQGWIKIRHSESPNEAPSVGRPRKPSKTVIIARPPNGNSAQSMIQLQSARIRNCPKWMFIFRNQICGRRLKRRLPAKGI